MVLLSGVEEFGEAKKNNDLRKALVSKSGTLLLYINKTGVMQNNSMNLTANMLNKLIQQFQPKSRVQLHDIAFYTRKYAFMQQALLQQKKK